ncbi:MAG TPA: DJ-1/PfpI family protein [Terriglobales bacterium]|nr:DJ-1/PfpI family protein [Terriglobales bacterium]
MGILSATTGQETLPQRQWPTRRISLLIFPRVHLMNLAGPLDVFARASQALSFAGKRQSPAYEIELLTMDDLPLMTASGLGLVGGRRWTQARMPIDTLLLIAGASGIDIPIAPELLAWLRSSMDHVRRIGSVCSGAFALAAAGILDGRRATTHWKLAGKLAKRYPQVAVDPDKIFVQDGKVWTSAGVSTGADLALAMVEEDHGHELALEVARHMVLFLRRSGGQSQFSSQLAAQASGLQPIRELIAWISEHLDGDLSVPALANRAGMSHRNFSRVFSQQVGTTPARFVARLRVQAAKARLEQTTDKVEAIASQAGFGDGEALRRQLRSEGATPRLYRARMAPSGAGTA